MVALRRSLGGSLIVDGSQGRNRSSAPDAAARAELRALAAAWPGALRELDTLDTAELDRRAACAERCADRDAELATDEPWLAWIARYHDLMRAALALRRGVSAADAGVDDDFARAVARPQHGRLNVTVFARLALEFDTPAHTLWDALFPRRGKNARRYRE
jgi:hypothetical protein